MSSRPTAAVLAAPTKYPAAGPPNSMAKSPIALSSRTSAPVYLQSQVVDSDKGNQRCGDSRLGCPARAKPGGTISSPNREKKTKLSDSRPDHSAPPLLLFSPRLPHSPPRHGLNRCLRCIQRPTAVLAANR